jgi:hypothetical protein
MDKDAFLESYGGQTTDQLIELDQRYRTDSIVLAFEAAIQQATQKRALSKEETYVLAVEGLEREVNNGGYSQFFLNSSNQYAGDIVAALRAIGCPKTADISAQAVANRENEKVPAECDERYFSNDEPIADRLFDWIKRNRAQIRIG